MLHSTEVGQHSTSKLLFSTEKCLRFYIEIKLPWSSVALGAKQEMLIYGKWVEIFCV